MTPKRTYHDGCAVAHALDLVGQRWALLALRELLFGPKRFSDLRAGLPAVSANVLALRLRELEEVGVVRRRRLGPPASAGVYELTEWGLELRGVITALGRWGWRSPLRDPQDAASPDSLMLALECGFDPRLGGGLQAVFGFRFGEDGFTARVAGGAVTVTRGLPGSPDAAVEADPLVFAGLLEHRLTVEEARRSGRMAVVGDGTAVELLFAAIPVVEPAWPGPAAPAGPGGPDEALLARRP